MKDLGGNILSRARIHRYPVIFLVISSYVPFTNTLSLFYLSINGVLIRNTNSRWYWGRMWAFVDFCIPQNSARLTPLGKLGTVSRGLYLWYLLIEKIISERIYTSLLTGLRASWVWKGFFLLETHSFCNYILPHNDYIS